jgi:predicted transcriptional regulator YdeE
MKKTELSLPELKLIGLTCRTSLNNEMNPSSAKIPTMLQTYFGNQSPEKIPHRLTPGTTYCVYTNYESDYTGEYDYFVGEAVSSFEEAPEGFSQLTIPTQYYVKVTAGPGQMPQVCIETWQKIWAIETEAASLGGKRNYLADFEVYDERAADPTKTILDVFVGIKK